MNVCIYVCANSIRSLAGKKGKQGDRCRKYLVPHNVKYRIVDTSEVKQHNNLPMQTCILQIYHPSQNHSFNILSIPHRSSSSSSLPPTLSIQLPHIRISHLRLPFQPPDPPLQKPSSAAQTLPIPHHDNLPPRPRHRHIQPPFLLQKPHLPFLVTPHQTYDDCVIFAALEGIYTSDFDAEERGRGGVREKEGGEEGDLGGVRG